MLHAFVKLCCYFIDISVIYLHYLTVIVYI
jgi:hypothetical protein